MMGMGYTDPENLNTFVCSFHTNLSFSSHLPRLMQVLATLPNWHLLWSQAMMLQSLGSL